MSDIPTSKAAQLVYGDLKYWPKQHFGEGGYFKPKVKYSRWNLIGDTTIVNSDGTICVQPKHRSEWKGAELISPILSTPVEESTWVQLQTYLDGFVENGATFSSKLYNSLHVHVGILDLDFEQFKCLPNHIVAVQDDLNTLRTDWTGSKKYFPNQLQRLQNAEDPKSWLKEYCTPGKITYRDYEYPVRKLVNLVNYFNNKGTIEFRCFKAKPNAEYIKYCVEFCLWLVDSWVNGTDYTIEFKDRVKEIDNWN